MSTDALKREQEKIRQALLEAYAPNWYKESGFELRDDKWFYGLDISVGSDRTEFAFMKKYLNSPTPVLLKGWPDGLPYSPIIDIAVGGRRGSPPNIMVAKLQNGDMITNISPERAIEICEADILAQGVISRPVAKLLLMARDGFLGREAAQEAYRLLEAFPIAEDPLPEEKQEPKEPPSPFALVEWD